MLSVCVCHVAVSLRPAGQRERVSGNDALRSLGAELKHVQQAGLVSALICRWRTAYQIRRAYIYLSDFRAFFFPSFFFFQNLCQRPRSKLSIPHPCI